MIAVPKEKAQRIEVSTCWDIFEFILLNIAVCLVASYCAAEMINDRTSLKITSSALWNQKKTLALFFCISHTPTLIVLEFVKPRPSHVCFGHLWSVVFPGLFHIYIKAFIKNLKLDFVWFHLKSWESCVYW